MNLDPLLTPSPNMKELSRILSEVGAPGAFFLVSHWGRERMASVFEAASGAQAITLASLVPGECNTEVICDGKNSLPLFSRFQKRFFRAEDGSVFGYNHQAMRGLTGPGYFCARQGDVTGEVVFDYTTLPRKALSAWPPIVSNHARLGRFAFEGMLDIVRGLSDRVFIGRAMKHGRFLDTYFVLVRR